MSFCSSGCWSLPVRRLRHGSFGLLDDLMDSLAVGSAGPAEPNRAAAPVAAPAVPEPKEAAADAPPAADAAATQAPAQAAEGQANAAPSAEPAVAKAASTKDVDAGVIKLEVTSQPTGAFVTVNGKRKGRTPIVLEHEVGTKLSIYAKIRGYLGQRQQVVVAAGQEPLTMQLVPLPYVVKGRDRSAGRHGECGWWRGCRHAR